MCTCDGEQLKRLAASCTPQAIRQQLVTARTIAAVCTRDPIAFCVMSGSYCLHLTDTLFLLQLWCSGVVELCPCCQTAIAALCIPSTAFTGHSDDSLQVLLHILLAGIAIFC